MGLARLLWWLAAGECLLYGWWAVALAGRGWPVLLALPFAFLAGALGLRLLLVLAMFALDRRYHSPRPPLSPVGWLRLLWGEYRAFLVCYLWLHPLAPWRMQAMAGPWPSPHAPVILVHGFCCNAGFWAPLQVCLAARRIRSYTLNLEPVFGSIDDFARQLAERVETVRRETGAPRVVLVGHSMGGLVSRIYVGDPHHARRVARLVTLGSPHRGTVLARLGRGRNVAQMRVLSPWLDGLNRAATPLIPVVSLYSLHDNIVIPQDSSELAGAENHAWAGIGHLELGFSAPVYERLLREITAA